MKTLLDTIAIYVDANTDDSIYQYNNAHIIPNTGEDIYINDEKYKVSERIFDIKDGAIMNVYIYIHRQ